MQFGSRYVSFALAAIEDLRLLFSVAFGMGRGGGCRCRRLELLLWLELPGLRLLAAVTQRLTGGSASSPKLVSVCPEFSSEEI